jgi:uncharacterized membrane protein YphA (DoxX/SURF4 family)
MKKTIVEVVIVLYTILFLYTGIAKLMDYSIFKEQIEDSPILTSIAKPIAIGLPWLEFLVVLLLLIPRWRLKGLYLSLGLMIAFTVYIIAIMLFDKTLPCSCGGIIQELSWTGHLIFNSVFICLAALAIKAERTIKRTNYINPEFTSMTNVVSPKDVFG